MCDSRALTSGWIAFLESSISGTVGEAERFPFQKTFPALILLRNEVTKMTTKDLITEYPEAERNNVFDYSSDYRMDKPRKGYEREFRAAKERVVLLEELIGQIK